MIMYHYCYHSMFVFVILSFLLQYFILRNVYGLTFMQCLRCILYMCFVLLCYPETSYAKNARWKPACSFFFLERFIWKYVLNSTLLIFFTFTQCLYWIFGLGFRVYYWAHNVFGTFQLASLLPRTFLLALSLARNKPQSVQNYYTHLDGVQYANLHFQKEHFLINI